jgi:hypothetical protein
MEPQDRKRVIEQWMTRVSQDGGIERYDELHIDAIDPQWKQRKRWAVASSSAFQCGVAVRNRLNPPLTVGLGMSLREDALEPTHEIELTDLVAAADWSPPALYLFREGHEPGHDLKDAIREGRVEADSVLSEFTALHVPTAKSSVFLRFKRSASDEYTTSVFILG